MTEWKSSGSICRRISLGLLLISFCCTLATSTHGEVKRSLLRTKLIPWAKDDNTLNGVINACKAAAQNKASYYYVWSSADPLLAEAPNGQAVGDSFFFKIGQTDDVDMFQRYSTDFTGFVRKKCRTRESAVNSKTRLAKAGAKRLAKLQKDKDKGAARQAAIVATMDREVDAATVALAKCKAEGPAEFADLVTFRGAIRCTVNDGTHNSVDCMDHCFRKMIRNSAAILNKNQIVFREADKTKWLSSGYTEFFNIDDGADIVDAMNTYFGTTCGFTCNICNLVDNGSGFISQCA